MAIREVNSIFWCKRCRRRTGIGTVYDDKIIGGNTGVPYGICRRCGDEFLSTIGNRVYYKTCDTLSPMYREIGYEAGARMFLKEDE